MFSVAATIIDHPYASVLLLLTLCCVVTRVKTGLQVQYLGATKTKGAARTVPVVPYWIPFVGHAPSFAWDLVGFLKNVAYNVPSGIFAVKIVGGTHNIITGPSLVREIYNRPNLPVNDDAIVFRILELAFGDHGYFREWDKRDKDGMWQVTKILHNLMKEPFLSNGIKNTTAAVEKRTWNLVSGNPSWVDHSRWERAGQVEIVSVKEKTGSFVAEADLFGLIRNFVGDISTTVLMGHAFLENNPTALDDLWTFDSKVHIFMLGVPRLLAPGLSKAAQARENLVQAVWEHHKAMIDVIEGRDPGYKYGDLSDVSSLIWERCRGFYNVKAPGRGHGVGDLVLLWALNVNANQVIFWMLFFIYSDPELLDQIRKEIKPYAQINKPVSDGLPISEAPGLKIDVEEILQNCPLLKGAFLETMRLQVASSAFRIASDDFVISESKEDAARLGKSSPDKYLIKKNDFICIPNQVHQEDPAFYPDPLKFDARRFWVKKHDEKGEEKISVEYGFMRAWGGGVKMCKGRNLAEREVVAFIAGILTVWDMEPVSKVGWKHPGNVITAGTFVPKKDIRVRLWRREELLSQ